MSFDGEEFARQYLQTLKGIAETAVLGFKVWFTTAIFATVIGGPAVYFLITIEGQHASRWEMWAALVWGVICCFAAVTVLWTLEEMNNP